MEKVEETKTVEMKPSIKAKKGKNEKIPYEELENIARQLHEQLNRAMQENQRLNLVNVYKRLDFLFKVVENSEKFNTDFVQKCTDEIENIMTIPEEETKEA